MRSRVLLDSGALLAYLDGQDAWHERCRDVFAHFRLPLMTSAAVLIRKYHDRPMDVADAALVHLAQRESLTTIFTVDHDDFETYRIGGRKRFRILPSR